MAKTATRQPKAKTAYELLERVCEAIKAHPLAYFQGSWVLSTKPRIQFAGNYTDAQMRESCGTAYCRAGWIVALHDGKREALELGMKEAHWPAVPVGDRANQILDVDASATYELFNACACAISKPGSRAYVRSGIRGLRAFMKRHKTHLQARSLKGV